METIQVPLPGHRHEILVGSGLLQELPGLLAERGLSGSLFVVTSARILSLCRSRRPDSWLAQLPAGNVLTVPDGESSKSLDQAARLYTSLIRRGADRSALLVGLGGGVIGDLAGFAAATYLRGIRFVQVPTTLLAQIDSSIGGKVGINHPLGKNLIGAFHQPSAVLSDTSTLRTMPPREIASGMFEVVKAGAIRSEPLLAYLEKRLDACLACRASALGHIVVECSRIKAEVVSGDETEEELRMVLNYGHTVGHALEAATRYRWFRHGEAVGWGMIAAVGYGRELGLLSGVEAARLVALTHSVTRLPSLEGIGIGGVWSALARDKKFRDGRIRMVLLSRLGETVFRSDIDPVHLKGFLRRFLQRRGVLQF